LHRICETEEIENIWCNHSHVAWYGLQLKEKRGVNIFLREHNIEFSLVHQVMQVQVNPIIKAFVWYQYLKTKRFEKKCWHIFSKTFFISDSDYNLAINEGIKNKGLLLYDSFEEGEVPPNNEKEAFSFIFPANLETFQNQYNLQKFIDEIWSPLIKKDSRWRLFVTGNKPGVLQNKIKADFKSYNIIDLGFVEDIQRTIATKKYFISPTYIGSGVRIKVLNAMSLGSVCFLSTLDVNMLNILQHNKNIIHFKDAKDFISNLERLEGEAETYNSISVQAMNIKKHFSWIVYSEKVADELSKF
jgi:hypothetical protein